MNRQFEWDEVKRLGNVEKHDIDFVDIGPAFDDDHAIVCRDLRMDYGEARMITTASCIGRILTIVFTLRSGTIRLISARDASRSERHRYERR